MKNLIVLILLYLMIGCSGELQKKLTDSEKNSIISELQPTIKMLIENEDYEDIDKFMESYQNSEDFLCISNGVVSNYNEYKNSCEEYLQYLESQEFNNSNFYYTFISDKTVIVTWNTNSVSRDKMGNTYTVDPYAVTFVMQKNDNDWKVSYSHGSGTVVIAENK